MSLRRTHGWTQMAEMLGVERCLGILRTGGYCHRRHARGGEVERRSGLPPIIHWGDRKSTRAGIRNFLLLVAEARVPPVAEEPWRRHYKVQRELAKVAAQAHVLLPAKLADRDKAELRAMLVFVPQSVPGRREAMEWALH